MYHYEAKRESKYICGTNKALTAKNFMLIVLKFMAAEAQKSTEKCVEHNECKLTN